jgi:hypothetical protein
MHRFLLSASIVFLSLSLAVAGDPVKSGPQAGEELPGPFEPFHVTGENAGEKACVYCQFGASPVAMVFARQVTPELTKLIKQLDQATAKNKSAEMASCIVFCSDDSAMKSKLAELAKKDGLKDVVLTIEKAAGPDDYNIGKEADVTVILYVDKKVKANHTFRKGELDEKAMGKIMSDLPKILPKK